MNETTNIGGAFAFVLGLIIVIALVHMTQDSEFVSNANAWFVETREALDLPSPGEIWDGLDRIVESALRTLIGSTDDVLKGAASSTRDA